MTLPGQWQTAAVAAGNRQHTVRCKSPACASQADGSPVCGVRSVLLIYNGGGANVARFAAVWNRIDCRYWLYGRVPLAIVWPGIPVYSRMVLSYIYEEDSNKEW